MGFATDFIEILFGCKYFGKKKKTNTKVDKVAWIPLVTVKWCSWGKNPENYDTDNTNVLVIHAGGYSSGKNNGLIVLLRRLQNEWETIGF